jgi:heterodisulfide reductase subunit A2
MRTGVFICQPDAEDRDGVVLHSIHSIETYAANLPNVEAVRILDKHPKLDPIKLATEINAHRLERIVIAGESPGFFKPAFTRAMALAGGGADEVLLASFRQHGAQEGGTARAKSILACAVFGVPFALAAIPESRATRPGTLVIGGGISGIQTALEIADSGKQVYLVERTPTIGGHMAMFDKTFPTLDCAACILTPKMVTVGQHEKIELMTYSEIENITGGPGAYRAVIRKKARHVDITSCVACNACTESCPRRAPSEFDSGIAERKAIYIPFPQAVPNAYVLDEASCLYFDSNGEKCGVCAKKCPKQCIDLSEKDQIVEIDVGNIVLATGYDIYDAKKIEQYGYGVLPNVITALEFERMTNASGPTGGKIVTKTKRLNKRTKAEEWVLDVEGPPPKSVAIIHCVGSRDARHNPYCSRVCCMYSLKFSHLVKEKLPGAACYEYYIDMRAFGKGYEEFAERIAAEGTFVVRGRTARILEVDGQMVVKGEDILSDRMVDVPVDLAILAVGLIPAHGSDRLADILRIARDQDGWFSELDYNSDPTETERGGIFVAGVCQGPKDIPDTVAQASAVAAGVLKSARTGRGLDSVAELSLADIENRARRLVWS